LCKAYRILNPRKSNYTAVNASFDLLPESSFHQTLKAAEAESIKGKAYSKESKSKVTRTKREEAKPNSKEEEHKTNKQESESKRD